MLGVGLLPGNHLKYAGRQQRRSGKESCLHFPVFTVFPVRLHRRLAIGV